jgi:hypothetical protein
VIVAVAEIMIVIAPVIVAALVNGNDTMDVIDAVSESADRCRADHADRNRGLTPIDAESYGRGIELLERVVAMLTKLIDP